MNHNARQKDSSPFLRLLQQPSPPPPPVPQRIKLPASGRDLTRFPVTTPQGSIVWATGVIEEQVDASPRATAPPVISLKLTPRNSECEKKVSGPVSFVILMPVLKSGYDTPGHKRILIQDQLRSQQISTHLAEQDVKVSTKL